MQGPRPDYATTFGAYTDGVLRASRSWTYAAVLDESIGAWAAAYDGPLADTLALDERSARSGSEEDDEFEDHALMRAYLRVSKGVRHDRVSLSGPNRGRIRRDLSALLVTINALTDSLIGEGAVRPGAVGDRGLVASRVEILTEGDEIQSTCHDDLTRRAARIVFPVRQLEKLYTYSLWSSLARAEGLDAAFVGTMSQLLEHQRSYEADLKNTRIPVTPVDLMTTFRPYDDRTRAGIEADLRRLIEEIDSGRLDAPEQATSWEPLRAALNARDLQRLRAWSLLRGEFLHALSDEENPLLGVFEMFWVHMQTDLVFNRALSFVLAHELYHLRFKPCQASPRIELEADAFAALVYSKIDVRHLTSVLTRSQMSGGWLGASGVGEGADDPSAAPALTEPDELGLEDAADELLGKPVYDVVREVYLESGAYEGSTLHGDFRGRLSAMEAQLRVSRAELARKIDAERDRSLDGLLRSILNQ